MAVAAILRDNIAAITVVSIMVLGARNIRNLHPSLASWLDLALALALLDPVTLMCHTHTQSVQCVHLDSLLVPTYIHTFSVMSEHVLSIQHPAGIERTQQHCISFLSLQASFCIHSFSRGCIYRQPNLHMRNNIGKFIIMW